MNKNPNLIQLVDDRIAQALRRSNSQSLLNSSPKTLGQYRTTPQTVGGAIATTTDNLTEGTTNLYFTNARVYTAVKNVLIEGTNISFTYNDENLTITINAEGGVTNTDVLKDNLMYNFFMDEVRATAAYMTYENGITDAYQDETGIYSKTGTYNVGKYYEGYYPLTNLGLLCHFNGADGSTTLTDETGKTLVADGTAQLDTAQYKFGASSLLLDGNSDGFHIGYHADFAFGSGDFTVAGWVRFNSIGAGVQTIAGVWVDGTHHSWIIQCTSSSLYLAYSTNGSDINIATNSEAVSFSTGTWYHIAIIRSSNNLKIYVDGVIKLNTAFSVTIYNPSRPLYVGYNIEGPQQYFNGWIDELVIAKSALWTTTFTPPATEYSKNLQLTSNTFTALVAPDTIRLIVMRGNTSPITLNTDLVLEVSRDGRTTWTTATLANVATYLADRYIDGATIDVSGQPSGTSIAYRLTTYNNVVVTARGVGLLWE